MLNFMWEMVLQTVFNPRLTQDYNETLSTNEEKNPSNHHLQPPIVYLWVLIGLRSRASGN